MIKAYIILGWHMTEGDMRAEIVAVVAHLEDVGLKQGSSGNISVRDGDGILITPAGAQKSNLTPDRMVRLDLDGRVTDDGDAVPSTEWRLHTELHRHRPEIGAVIHSHADSCVALSCLRKPLPAFQYQIASFGGDEVPCSRYAPFGSDALADAVVEAMGDRYLACLMANHGMIVVGRSLEHARGLALKLEALARQYILACTVGAPVMLDAEEMAEVHRRYPYYGKARLPR